MKDWLQKLLAIFTLGKQKPTLPRPPHAPYTVPDYNPDAPNIQRVRWFSCTDAPNGRHNFPPGAVRCTTCGASSDDT